MLCFNCCRNDRQAMATDFRAQLPKTLVAVIEAHLPGRVWNNDDWRAVLSEVAPTYDASIRDPLDRRITLTHIKIALGEPMNILEADLQQIAIAIMDRLREGTGLSDSNQEPIRRLLFHWMEMTAAYESERILSDMDAYLERHPNCATEFQQSQELQAANAHSGESLEVADGLPAALIAFVCRSFPAKSERPSRFWHRIRDEVAPHFIAGIHDDRYDEYLKLRVELAGFRMPPESILPLARELQRATEPPALRQEEGRPMAHPDFAWLQMKAADLVSELEHALGATGRRQDDSDRPPRQR